MPVNFSSTGYPRLGSLVPYSPTLRKNVTIFGYLNPDVLKLAHLEIGCRDQGGLGVGEGGHFSQSGGRLPPLHTYYSVLSCPLSRNRLKIRPLRKKRPQQSQGLRAIRHYGCRALSHRAREGRLGQVPDQTPAGQLPRSCDG